MLVEDQSLNQLIDMRQSEGGRELDCVIIYSSWIIKRFL